MGGRVHVRTCDGWGIYVWDLGTVGGLMRIGLGKGGVGYDDDAWYECVVV